MLFIGYIGKKRYELDIDDYGFISSELEDPRATIERIVVPKGITRIPNGAFENFSRLKRVGFCSRQLKEIGERAFAGCKALSEMHNSNNGTKDCVIPATVTDVGKYAFENCEELNRVKCSGIEIIEEGTFKGCKSLKYISLPNSITKIGDNAFEGCALNRVYLEKYKALIEIGKYAFSKCTSIVEVTLPDSLETIGKNAFDACKSLIKIDLPRNLKTISEAMLIRCCSLEKIGIPDSVTIIGGYAFSLCTALKEIKIPKGVTYIGDYAFEACGSLKDITFPESVKSFGCNVFWRAGAIDVRYKCHARPR